MTKKKKGNLFIISAPSGSGKTTLEELVLKSVSGLERSISVTTRAKRPGERDGRDYFFVSKSMFLKKVALGEFLEHAKVLGNYYGTPKAFVKKELAAGKDLILSIDIQGARQVKKTMPEAVRIFIVPPSMKILRARLHGRKTDGHKEIETRLRLAEREMLHAEKYDYIVVNDKLNESLKDLGSIIVAERCRVRKR